MENKKNQKGTSMAKKRVYSSKEKNFKKKYLKKYGIQIKEQKDIEKIKEAGKLVIKTLDLVEENIRVGMTTDEINTLVHNFTIENGAIPAPLGYRGFPKSTCTSVNEVICHGIPGDRILQDGDIVNVDVTSILNGYYADANKTFFVGTPGEDAEKIVTIAKKSMKLGIKQAKPGNTLGDIGHAIQSYAENHGTSVVREFVGHGIGFQFHEPPNVFHYGSKGAGLKLVPGMVFTIEPMINLGQKELFIKEDNWTAVTKDGKLSAQFEQTIVVTETGPESLTPYD